MNDLPAGESIWNVTDSPGCAPASVSLKLVPAEPLGWRHRQTRGRRRRNDNVWPTFRSSAAVRLLAVMIVSMLTWKRYTIAVRVSPDCTWYCTGGAVVVVVSTVAPDDEFDARV